MLYYIAWEMGAIGHSVRVRAQHLFSALPALLVTVTVVNGKQPMFIHC